MGSAAMPMTEGEQLMPNRVGDHLVKGSGTSCLVRAW